MNALRIGDPFDDATDIGPLAMPQIVDDLEKQVKASIDAGAKEVRMVRALRPTRQWAIANSVRMYVLEAE